MPEVMMVVLLSRAHKLAIKRPMMVHQVQLVAVIAKMPYTIVYEYCTIR